MIKSQFHDITLELTGRDEPNNGRDLHTCDLRINGKLENFKYFDDWNRLNLQLDKLAFDSVDGRYVYVPAESGGFLIDTTTFSKVQLPYKSLSTLTFKGNLFSKDILVIIYSDEIMVFNTSQATSTQFKFPAGNVIWCETDENDELLVTFIDPETKTQTIEKLSQ